MLVSRAAKVPSRPDAIRMRLMSRNPETSLRIPTKYIGGKDYQEKIWVSRSIVLFARVTRSTLMHPLGS